MWLRQLGVILCWCSLVLSVTSTRADDTELFIYDFNKAGDFRPKVLLIFDNSGSMRDTMEQVKEAYDPTISYPPLQNDPTRTTASCTSISPRTAMFPASQLAVDSPTR